MGRRHYVPMKRHHDILIRRREDGPLRRLGDVPLRRRWVFHLKCICDVTGTYRETLLRRLHDVLLPGGLFLSIQSVLSMNIISPISKLLVSIDQYLIYFYIQFAI